MYHRILKVYIATQNSQLETFLQSVPPVNNFSHQFISHPEIKIADLKQDEIIILDFDTVPPESLEKIFLAKNDPAAVIGCFTPDNYSILTDNYHLFDQVWIQPFSKNKVCTSFGRILKRFKEQEDSVLNLQYLDTLIDSLPDLIWFKDARGSHIKPRFKDGDIIISGILNRMNMPKGNIYV